MKSKAQTEKQQQNQHVDLIFLPFPPLVRRSPCIAKKGQADYNQGYETDRTWIPFIAYEQKMPKLLLLQPIAATTTVDD